MSEPHDELEERAALAVAQFFGENDSPLDAARAVLALVRQEQENGQYSEKINEIWWNNGGPKPPLAEVIRAWWLSHTAPQEK